MTVRVLATRLKEHRSIPYTISSFLPPSNPVLTAACSELIKALEECHAKSYLKFFGACNDQKHELNMCLRKEVSLCRVRRVWITRGALRRPLWRYTHVGKELLRGRASPTLPSRAQLHGLLSLGTGALRAVVELSLPDVPSLPSLSLNTGLLQRVDRTTRNRESAKERTKKKQEAWAKIDAETAEVAGQS